MKQLPILALAALLTSPVLAMDKPVEPRNMPLCRAIEGNVKMGEPKQHKVFFVSVAEKDRMMAAHDKRVKKDDGSILLISCPSGR